MYHAKPSQLVRCTLSFIYVKIFLWCFHNGRRLPSDVINSVSLKIPQEGGVTDGYTRSYCFAELMHC